MERIVSISRIVVKIKLVNILSITCIEKGLVYSNNYGRLTNDIFIIIVIFIALMVMNHENILYEN